MLGGEENLFLAGKGFFQGSDTGFTANHKRRHHMGKNDDIANWHHRESLGFGLFFCAHVSLNILLLRSRDFRPTRPPGYQFCR